MLITVITCPWGIQEELAIWAHLPKPWEWKWLLMTHSDHNFSGRYVYTSRTLFHTHLHITPDFSPWLPLKFLVYNDVPLGYRDLIDFWGSPVCGHTTKHTWTRISVLKSCIWWRTEMWASISKEKRFNELCCSCTVWQSWVKSCFAY
jgi:hypothetical protein